MVLDAAMNDLMRPALYDAWHGIVPVSAVDALGQPAPADVVGPVCETGDTFARGRMLPPLAPNARVAILDAGAYGAVMSSTYNARPLAAVAMVDGDRWDVVRSRQGAQRTMARRTHPRVARMTAPEKPTTSLHRRLALRRALARMAILFERLWPALWPPLGVIGLLVCLALLDILPNLPPLLHLAVLVIGGLAVVVLLVHGLRGVSRPDEPRPTGGWSAPLVCVTGRFPFWWTGPRRRTRREPRCGRRMSCVRRRRFGGFGSAYRVPDWRAATAGRCGVRWWWVWSRASVLRGAIHRHVCGRLCSPRFRVRHLPLQPNSSPGSPHRHTPISHPFS